MKIWKIALILLLTSALFTWGVLSYYVHGTASNQYPLISQNYSNHQISTDSIINSISKENISDHFPFKSIAENIQLSDYQKQRDILNFLEKLDSNQYSRSQEYLFFALSDTLLKTLQNTQDLDDLNVLTSLTNEITSLFYYSKQDIKNEIFYEALFDYWMLFINHQLESVVNNNYWEKYSFEYRYISTISQQFNYNPSTGLNSTEKVLNNLSENKYGYLFNRFILRTTIYQKIGIAFALSIIILSFWYSLSTIIKKTKKL